MMWEKIKREAYGLVIWAENSLAGKSGAEKRKAVVKKMCEVIDWPFVPEFIEGLLEPIIYGWVVDKLCGLLNIVGEHDFGELSLTGAQEDKVLGLVTLKDGVDVIPSPAEMELPPECHADSVDDRIAALYAKYVSK